MTRRKPRQPTERVPAAPVFAWMYATIRDNTNPEKQSKRTSDPLTDVQLAEVLGCSRSAVAQARKTGSVDVWKADRWATRLGVHPLLFWPDFYDRVQWTLDDDLSDLVMA